MVTTLNGKLSREEVGTLSKALSILKKNGIDIRSKTITMDSLVEEVNREYVRHMMNDIINPRKEEVQHD